jgi:hypothetical protein
MKTRIELHSKVWPDIHAIVWNVGNAWCAKFWSHHYPQGARLENFPSLQSALAHAKIVLGN